MKRKYKNMEFSLQYYKYDKQPTKAYLVIIDHPTKYRAGGNHSFYEIPLTYEQKNKVWTIAVSQGKEKASDEVKRIFRAMISRDNRYVQFPYRLEGGDIISIQGRWVKASASLKDRYENAKAHREAFSEENWVYSTGITTGKLGVKNGKFEFDEGKFEKHTRKILPDGCETWREYYQRSLNSLENELKRLTA